MSRLQVAARLASARQREVGCRGEGARLAGGPAGIGDDYRPALAVGRHQPGTLPRLGAQGAAPRRTAGGRMPSSATGRLPCALGFEAGAGALPRGSSAPVARLRSRRGACAAARRLRRPGRSRSLQQGAGRAASRSGRILHCLDTEVLLGERAAADFDEGGADGFERGAGRGSKSVRALRQRSHHVARRGEAGNQPGTPFVFMVSWKRMAPGSASVGCGDARVAGKAVGEEADDLQVAVDMGVLEGARARLIDSRGQAGLLLALLVRA